MNAQVVDSDVLPQWAAHNNCWCLALPSMLIAASLTAMAVDISNSSTVASYISLIICSTLPFRSTGGKVRPRPRRASAGTTRRHRCCALSITDGALQDASVSHRRPAGKRWQHQPRMPLWRIRAPCSKGAAPKMPRLQPNTLCEQKALLRGRYSSFKSADTRQPGDCRRYFDMFAVPPCPSVSHRRGTCNFPRRPGGQIMTAFVPRAL